MKSERSRSRPFWAPYVETVGVAGFGLLLFQELQLLLQEASDWLDGLRVIVGGAVGFLLADFLSGCAHWFCDTYFEEDSPVIGSMLIGPFREHHRLPKAMTEHGFLELNGNNCLILIPVVGFALIQVPPDSGLGLFAHAVVLSVAVSIFATNQIHCWAHSDSRPRAATWLQAHGLILTPEHHDRHHQEPHDSHFCITTGWMNPWIDRLGFFRQAERFLGVAGFRSARQLGHGVRVR